jgi:hypothetical protein
MRSLRMRRSVLLGLACLLACASNPANTVTPGFEGAPGLERFLVCAPNTVISLPAELQNGTGALRDQIDAYLRFHDRKPQSLDLYTCQKLWSQAMAAAKEHGALEQTPAFFARKLDEIYDFDAIVMPSLLLHEERTTNGYGSWDGVDRRMQVLKGPDWAFKRDRMAQAVAQAGASGNFLVTSVHVLVFSPAGERIFEGRGGIEFVHDLDLTAFARKRKIEFKPRDDLPGGIDAVREGIAIAFAPFLTMPEE